LFIYLFKLTYNLVRAAQRIIKKERKK